MSADAEAGVALCMTAPEYARIREAGVAQRKKFLETAEEFPWFECLGEQVRYKPYYTNRDHDRVEIQIRLRADASAEELDEAKSEAQDYIVYAVEWTSHRWMRDVRVSHWVFTDWTSKEKAEAHLQRAGLTGTITEAPYADPTRWHIWVSEDVEDVIKLWQTRKG